MKYLDILINIQTNLTMKLSSLNNFITKKSSVLFALIMIFVLPLQAQEDLVQYFPAGQANAELLINEYVKTLAEGFTAANNNGWYSDAKPHDKFGFDFNVTINAVFVPTSKQFFSFGALGLSGVQLDPGAYSDNVGDNFPTALGAENAFPYMMLNSGPNNGAMFRGPEGVDLLEDVPLLKAIAVPTMQFGIGLVKNTDLKLRFTPKIKISETEFSTFGIGILHDIKQHFPAFNVVPMGFSVLIAYSSFNGTVALHEEYGGPSQDGAQEGEFSATGLTFQLLASKTFSVVTFYGGLGYNSGKSDFDVKGTYNIGSAANAADPNTATNLVLASPFTINPFTLSYKTSGIRWTTGMRLKFGPVTLSGDYTLADDKVLTLGFGFAHR